MISIKVSIHRLAHHYVGEEHPDEEHAHPVDGAAADVSRGPPGLQEEVSGQRHGHPRWNNTTLFSHFFLDPMIRNQVNNQQEITHRVQVRKYI